MNNLRREIVRQLREARSVLVLTHYRPDGDAVGSQLALGLALQRTGKKVSLWNDDPVPAKFRFLPGSEQITTPSRQPRAFDVVVAVDSSTWSRLGTAAERIARRRCLINIDHHVSNERYGDLNWVEPNASATGQLIYRLIQTARWPIERDVATALFVALSTDTGSFSYANTTAESLRMAAKLVASGVDVGTVSRHVYESYPSARLHLLQRVLAELKLIHHRRIAYYWVTNEMLEESRAKREDIEGVIDYARSIDSVVVAILFEELPEPRRVRVSFRSKDRRVAVDAIAKQFGGGGHPEAAGARIEGAPATVERNVLAATRAALRAAGL
ncbi:MAG: bifunctional oligoribonuclease/PAP phosphatase NrnA [Verrucomicrobiae bacterium]|nr:bifunctional oligoribonuclease/PAP phosphatase NrnA [Verrucomicrobiae bacterium]